MMNHIGKIIGIVLGTILLVGCASFGGGNISSNNPDAYGDAQVDRMSNQDLIGEEAMLGGVITTINTQGNRTRVEVARYELNNDGAPMSRTGALKNNRLIVDIDDHVSRGYTTGDYFTAVGKIKSVDDISIGGEKVRVIVMDASDFEFWQDPRRDRYYDDYGFNSPAIRVHHYNAGWGFGFGPYFPYYY